MEIQQLLAAHAFVPTKIIRKDIKITRPVPTEKETWTDPEVPEYGDETVTETWTMHVRFGTSADEIEMARASDRERPFIAIWRYICDANGKPLFESLEQAMQLKSWVVIPMFNAIGEVTGSRPKSSRRRMSSGSKSPSPSADAPRKNGSTASPQSGATA